MSRIFLINSLDIFLCRQALVLKYLLRGVAIDQYQKIFNFFLKLFLIKFLEPIINLFYSLIMTGVRKS